MIKMVYWKCICDENVNVDTADDGGDDDVVEVDQ